MSHIRIAFWCLSITIIVALFWAWRVASEPPRYPARTTDSTALMLGRLVVSKALADAHSSMLTLSDSDRIFLDTFESELDNRAPFTRAWIVRYIDPPPMTLFSAEPGEKPEPQAIAASDSVEGFDKRAIFEFNRGGEWEYAEFLEPSVLAYMRRFRDKDGCVDCHQDTGSKCKASATIFLD